MTNEQIKALLEAGLPDAEAHVDGDGTHFVAKVITDSFRGLSPVKQHQLVYGALGESMKSAIHALSIQTYTKEEWRRQRAFEPL